MKKLILSFLILSACSPLKEYADTKAVFEKEVSALEKLDVASTASKNELLFVGSSSVRLWDNIKNDMSPYRSVKRGYGGAHYYDLIHFTNRLVTSHNPKAILLFVAYLIVIYNYYKSFHWITNKYWSKNKTNGFVLTHLAGIIFFIENMLVKYNIYPKLVILIYIYMY